jgi:hypothetical protein
MLVLHDFILQYRTELIERTRAKVRLRTEPRATPHELVSGIPMFLTQLGIILEKEAAHSSTDGLDMRLSATIHGGELLKEGLSIAATSARQSPSSRWSSTFPSPPKISIR